MPGLAPTYRIGPSDFFTSDDLAADANTLNSQMNSLDDQNWDHISESLFDGWNAFLQEWRAFYKSTFSWVIFGPAWNDANRDQLIQFETRFDTFAQQWKTEAGADLPGGVVAPSDGSKDTLGQHLKNQLQPLVPSTSVWVVLGVIVALVVGGWVYLRFFRKAVP